MFYAYQTLKSIHQDGKSLPLCVIKDQPRFAYRGMHLDVGRNFFSKEEILKILETMAMYKLNQFHFHLTEDEGWRLEIPGIPELTEVYTEYVNYVDVFSNQGVCHLSFSFKNDKHPLYSNS